MEFHRVWGFSGVAWVQGFHQGSGEPVGLRRRGSVDTSVPVTLGARIVRIRLLWEFLQGFHKGYYEGLGM